MNYDLGCRMPVEDWLLLNRTLVFDDPSLLRYVSPFPPAELMAITAGFSSHREFAGHGADFYRALEVLSHKPLNEYESILDFGCGCGRLSRMFKGHPHKISGCDIDRRHIDWVTENLEFVEAKLSRPNPPLPYEDNEFEAIVSISIFTHLTERSQDQFLRELARVCRPDGRLFLTVHGQRAMDRALSEPRIRSMLSMSDWRFARARLQFALGRLAFVLQPDSHLTTRAGDGRILPNKQIDVEFDYGIAFTPERYIRSHWAKWFNVLSFVPGAIHDFQDIVVLTPRKAGA